MTLRTAGVIGLVLASFVPAFSFEYTATPLTKALVEHDLVLVGTVKERAGGEVKVEPLVVIKGRPPGGHLKLPDIWRPRAKFTFEPVPLETGKTYLLMLHRRPTGDYTLSADFAADAVVAVSSRDASIVRAATVLHTLSQQEKVDSRKATLAEAWKKESDETKLSLLVAFAGNPADPATIEFLIQAMNVGHDRSSLMEMSAIVIQRHKYKEAIPSLLQVLRKKDWSALYPAKTLGLLKAREAYEPIMALIEDESTGNRPYFIEALSLLEDKRAIAFFLKTLHRNLPELDPGRGSYRSWSAQENEFAAAGLGRLRAVEAVDPLIRLLDVQGYKELRTKAVEALGEIGPPALKAASRIRQLVREERVSADVAEEALKKIERGK